MGDDEAHEASAAVSGIGPEDQEAGSDQNQEQASTAQTKDQKIQGLTKSEDEYAVIKQRETLNAKANTGDFKGRLRAVTPARSNTAKTSKNSSKYFVYGVLFGSMMTLTTRDMTVCETYAQCVVLPNKANAC